MGKRGKGIDYRRLQQPKQEAKEKKTPVIIPATFARRIEGLHFGNGEFTVRDIWDFWNAKINEETGETELKADDEGREEVYNGGQIEKFLKTLIEQKIIKVNGEYGDSYILAPVVVELLATNLNLEQIIEESAKNEQFLN